MKHSSSLAGIFCFAALGYFAVVDTARIWNFLKNQSKTSASLQRMENNQGSMPCAVSATDFFSLQR